MSEKTAKASSHRSTASSRRGAKGPGESDTALIDAISADFRKHGAAAIASIRTKDPASYLKLCASILPNAVAETIDPFETLTDEELVERARRLAAQLDVGLGPNARQAGAKKGSQ